MFLIRAIKTALESMWCGAQMVIASLVLLAVIIFKIDVLDFDKDDDDER